MNERVFWEYTAKETMGFEPDLRIDDEDPVSVVLEHIKRA